MNITLNNFSWTWSGANAQHDMIIDQRGERDEPAISWRHTLTGPSSMMAEKANAFERAYRRSKEIIIDHDGTCGIRYAIDDGTSLRISHPENVLTIIWESATLIPENEKHNSNNNEQ